MKFVICMSIFLLSAGNCFAAQADRQTIKSVIKAFEESIQAKDKSRFLSLFVDPAAPMVAVVSDEGMVMRRALVEKINKEQNKKLVATRSFKVTPTQAIEGSVGREESSREALSNIKIVSDGNIANVYFDYVYYIDDKKNNWGSESWQMVQTLTGWKISSVVYSVTSQ